MIELLMDFDQKQFPMLNFGQKHYQVQNYPTMAMELEGELALTE